VCDGECGACSGLKDRGKLEVGRRVILWVLDYEGVVKET